MRMRVSQLVACLLILSVSENAYAVPDRPMVGITPLRQTGHPPLYYTPPGWPVPLWTLVPPEQDTFFTRLDRLAKLRKALAEADQETEPSAKTKKDPSIGKIGGIAPVGNPHAKSPKKNP